MFWLKVLDVILFMVHIAVISFNLFGWIKPSWRYWHRWCLFLTLFSWLILGIWKGWGYCFLTDWEWKVKYRIGEEDLPASFVTYLFNNLLGFRFSEDLINLVTISCLLLAIAIALYQYLREKKKK